MWIFPIGHFLSFAGPLPADDDRSRLRSRIYGRVEAGEIDADVYATEVEEPGSRGYIFMASLVCWETIREKSWNRSGMKRRKLQD